MTFNVSGGQVSFATGNAVIHATQYNGISGNELDNIIKSIMDDVSQLNKEDAENIVDVVNMAKEELIKTKPGVSRLRNCVTLISPMLSIANGIPTLAGNLQKLIDYITPYIH